MSIMLQFAPVPAVALWRLTPLAPGCTDTEPAPGDAEPESPSVTSEPAARERATTLNGHALYYEDHGSGRRRGGQRREARGRAEVQR